MGLFKGFSFFVELGSKIPFSLDISLGGGGVEAGPDGEHDFSISFGVAM